jgi:hypothetical protein
MKSRPSGNDHFRELLRGFAPGARKRKTSQEIVAFLGPFPITTDDLSRFPPALASPRSPRGNGLHSQPAKSMKEKNMNAEKEIH